MTINLADDLLQLLAQHDKLTGLNQGTSHLSVGLHDILLFEENGCIISKIADGKLKEVVNTLE